MDSMYFPLPKPSSRKSSSLRRLTVGGDGFAIPKTKLSSLRKRKRRDSDNLSVHSLDISFKEPGLKRKKRISRVASLASLIASPVRPVMKVGEALQRTWSGVKISSPILISKLPDAVPMSPSSSPPSSGKGTPVSSSSSSSSPPMQQPQRRNSVKLRTKAQPTPTRQRQSRLWTETVASTVIGQHLTDREIQRQEAIFELYQGEEDMAEDLHLVKTTYHDSLLHLNIMTDDEVQQIFGSMHTLEPLHQDLITKLRKLRDNDGITSAIGRVLVDWIPCLTHYVAYCANQVYAKALLDEKKTNDRRVEDFLQRCLESPFSRKLDLWNFLDVPRNRLVKYPLLFKNILKLTPANHEDVEFLTKAMSMVDDLIQTVDKKMGESECLFYINKFDYLEEKQREPIIKESTCLLCKGILKNNRGTKLHSFLFDKVLVLSRPVTRGDRGRLYQVYRQPIPTDELIVDDIKDGEAKMGSFRSAFAPAQSAKNLFRVGFADGSRGQSHTLQACDEHDKKQWLYNFKKVIGDNSTTENFLPPRVLRPRDSNADCNRSLSSHSSTSSISSLNSINMDIKADESETALGTSV